MGKPRLTLFSLILLIPWVGGVSWAGDRTHEIGVQAYIYAYPMVLMETSRRFLTNVEAVEFGHAPMNQIVHLRGFPDHNFKKVVRPNADTLYSIIWFDVSTEPQVLSIADTGGRYFVLQILDFWTDVIASPGSRTSGTSDVSFAIVGPNWQGTLPEGVKRIRATTDKGWVIGRTQTNGKGDYRNVHKIQDGYTVTPLSAWGQDHLVRRWDAVNTDWDMETRPPVQVARMTAESYFELFAELMKNNPPHEVDWNMVQLLKQIGIIPGESFRFSALPIEDQEALEQAMADAQTLIRRKQSGQLINGWRFTRENIGNYGTSYLQRAYVAMVGLGANVPEDAVYPITNVDSDGNVLDGSHRYVMHFEKSELPPVRGFWSLSMYGEDYYFVDNPIDRYAIGDRNILNLNDDGSLDIFIQNASPGDESNWLPAPHDKFNLTLRGYWPKTDMVTGRWDPPPVVRLR